MERFDLSRDGKRLAYVLNVEGASALRVRDLTTGREADVPLPGLGTVGAVEWHPNGRDLAFTFSDARSPSDVYAFDADSGRVERWTESETGGLNAREFRDPELIRWKGADGRPISGFLYTPPVRFTGRRPVIVNIHGGPEGQSRPGFLGRSNYFLNELGVAILFPNVRGSTGYGKTFLKLDNGVQREDSVKDIGALLDWIGKRGRTSTPPASWSRAAATAGYMTLASASPTIRAHPLRARRGRHLQLRHLPREHRGLPPRPAARRVRRRARSEDARAFLEQISPLNNAHKIVKPLFVVQGQNDPRVPLSEAEQIVEAVRANGTPGLVPHGQGRGARLRQEEERRLPVLRHGRLRAGEPAEVAGEGSEVSRGTTGRSVPGIRNALRGSRRS